jgi:hypothetical protein
MGKVLDKRSALDGVTQVSFVKLGSRKALSFLWPKVQLHLRVFHETVRLESEELRGNVRVLRHRLHYLQPCCSWRSRVRLRSMLVRPQMGHLICHNFHRTLRYWTRDSAVNNWRLVSCTIWYGHLFGWLFSLLVRMDQFSSYNEWEVDGIGWGRYKVADFDNSFELCNSIKISALHEGLVRNVHSNPKLITIVMKRPSVLKLTGPHPMLDACLSLFVSDVR